VNDRRQLVKKSFLDTYLRSVCKRSTQIGEKSSFYILTSMLSYIVYANDRFKLVKVVFFLTYDLSTKDRHKLTFYLFTQFGKKNRFYILTYALSAMIDTYRQKVIFLLTYANW